MRNRCDNGRRMMACQKGFDGLLGESELTLLDIGRVVDVGLVAFHLLRLPTKTSLLSAIVDVGARRQPLVNRFLAPFGDLDGLEGGKVRAGDVVVDGRQKRLHENAGHFENVAGDLERRAFLLELKSVVDRRGLLELNLDFLIGGLPEGLWCIVKASASRNDDG